MHHFAVWAPLRKLVRVEVKGIGHVMDSGEHGWWHATIHDAEHGSDYLYYLDDDQEGYPDPRSMWQPYGVHGPSRIFDHSRFQWADHTFQPVALPEAVIYELHIGTFTLEGTFAAAEEKLAGLRDLGITHVELMPVNSFPGAFGWGYDGVALFAPQESYGGPPALQHFVKAAHSHQLAVLLDVVYNHFGPVGNYTGKFGPYLTEGHSTPWGGAVNLEEHGSTEVRRFFCDNALMWLREYHFDGLRLDAIQTFVDRSAIHFLEQLSEEVEELSRELNRHLVLIAESALNDPRVVTPRKRGDGYDQFGYGFDAQWSDDFHHALTAFLTGQRDGYYGDFGSLAQVAKSLTSVFVYDGIYSEHRGRIHGQPAGATDRNRFLGYLQNHDQVGNQVHGQRLCALVGLRQAKVAAALMLAGPFIPMLFQGEEFAASSPFLYFAQYEDPVIAQSVLDGRRREHAHQADANSVADPGAQRTFENSKLRWDEREEGEHGEMLAWYRGLTELRRSTPSLRDGRPENCSVQLDEDSGWLVLVRGTIGLYFNFGDGPVTLAVPQEAMIALASPGDARIEAGEIRLAGSSFVAVSMADSIQPSLQR